MGVFIKMQSGIDGESESEKEVEDSTIMSRKALYKSGVPQLEIPFAVQNVISRIEQAQLYRARELWKVDLLASRNPRTMNKSLNNTTIQ
uniref:protein FAM186A-like n=1 Tax=Halichoerus grypus TaxID=9711 RepID=UPI001659DA59|nr:protein FAM186A-like [Halichoerus grypus]